MKKHPRILLFIILITCFSYTSNSQDTTTVLKIAYVDFNINTFVAVPCSEFESNFNKKFKYWQTNDKKGIEVFEKYLNKFKKVNRDHIDTRGKINYIHNNQLKEMCFDQFGIFTDCVNYYKNPELFNIIKTKIN